MVHASAVSLILREESWHDAGHKANAAAKAIARRSRSRCTPRPQVWTWGADVEALINEDIILAGRVVMILSFLTVLGTLLSRPLLVVLDPRIRFEGGSR